MYFLSLKVVKFDTKMYLNFSNFQGQTSAGGTSLGPKTGTSVGWGDWQDFCRMGKNPGHSILHYDYVFVHMTIQWVQMQCEHCFSQGLVQWLFVIVFKHAWRDSGILMKVGFPNFSCWKETELAEPVTLSMYVGWSFDKIFFFDVFLWDANTMNPR